MSTPNNLTTSSQEILVVPISKTGDRLQSVHRLSVQATSSI